MKTLISTLFLAGSLVLGGCGDKEKEENRTLDLYSASDIYFGIENKLECSCLPEIGLPPKLKLIECYDIDKDGDLDCIYKQDSTQRILLYETRDNGHEHTLAGEFSKQD